MIRQQIWTNLVNTKFKCIYLGHLIHRDKRISLGINIFLAIISLSSISAWTIWKILPGLFTSLIAISNILMVIKPILSFDKRIKELNEKIILLEDVQFEYEKLWYHFETNRINENKVSETFFEIYEKQKNSLRTSSELIIGKNKKITSKSDSETDSYIRNHYGYTY
ncbi:MAG: hypothetical protein LLG13_07010 [Bacteroidales bacterium]|nr:hypothetical protein [Bacteroidales bacterium]